MEKILLLIENHGISLVLLIMFIFWLKPKINQIWDLAINGKNNHIESFKNNFSTNINKTLMINNCLNKILYNSGVDRVYIFEYHNGGHNIAGIDFAKASNTYEVVASGIKPQQQMLQNLPLGMFAPFIRGATDGVIDKSIEQFKEEQDYSSYETLKQQGIKRIYAVGIRDENNRPIGFIGIDICKKDKVLSDECKEHIKKIAERLSLILENKSNSFD